MMEKSDLTFSWFMLCTGLCYSVQKVLVLSGGCTACSCNSLAPVKKKDGI